MFVWDVAGISLVTIDKDHKIAVIPHSDLVNGKDVCVG